MTELEGVKTAEPFVIPPARADVGATAVHHRHESDGSACVACVLHGLADRAEQGEAELTKIKKWLVEFWLSENDVTSDVAGQFLRAVAHAAAAEDATPEVEP